MSKYARRFMAVYLPLLAAFCVWVLLDAFVIRYAETTAEQPSAVSAAPAAPIVTADSYVSGSISVTLREETWNGTAVHTADVVLTDASLLRAALAEDTYGRNITETVAAQAERHDAILAINGDYYGSRRTGYVIRNGVLYRAAARKGQTDLCLWPDGTMTLIREDEISAESLSEQGVLQVFSFGPGLVENGEVLVSALDEVEQAMTSNPRTAVAMIEPLHYLLAVSDGRTEENAGLSLLKLAEFLRDRGAVTAYNLDGGGSSTMVFMGEVINFPTARGFYQERAVSDIVYIAE